MKIQATYRMAVFLLCTVLFAALSTAQQPAGAPSRELPLPVEAEKPALAPVPAPAEPAAPVKMIEEVEEVEAIPEDKKNEEDDEGEFIPLDTGEETDIKVSDSAEAGKDRPELINISVDNETLENVLHMFTKMSGINIIATATNLTGRVTVNLTEVEWQPALSSILAMHNLAIVEKIPGSSVYSVVDKPEGAPEPMKVETLSLKFTTSSEVQPVIKSMLTPGGEVTDFASRNTLVVRSTASNLGEIRELLKNIDIPSKQVCIEAKFMELSDEATKELGIQWDSLASFGVSLQAGPFSSSETTERTKTSGQQSSRWSYKSQVDRASHYTDVYGAPLELTYTPGYTEDTDSETLSGQSFSVQGATAPTLTSLKTQDDGEYYADDIMDSFTKTITEEQSLVLEMDALDMVLSALQGTEGVSVISNPKMIVANGTTNAFFRVGERWPIVKTTVEAGTTDSPGDTIEAGLDTDIKTEYIEGGYLRTGIELLVIPVVKTEDMIQAEIIPTLTTKTGDKTVGNNSWPEITVKEIRTRFTLKSGQTVAIGGLTGTTESKETSKIPLLGDIPVIGKYLFSYEKDYKGQTETIIFVTLTMAEPASLYKEAGVPEEADLVYKKMLERDAFRRKRDAELQQLKEAEKAEMDEEREKARNQLDDNNK